MSRNILGRSLLNNARTEMENVTALSQGEWHINNCQEFNKDLVQPLDHVAAPLPLQLELTLSNKAEYSHMFLFNLMYSGLCKRTQTRRKSLP